MRITARPVRDEAGRRPLPGSGIFYTDLRAQTLGKLAEDVWVVVDLMKFFRSSLIDLSAMDRFNLLATRLMNVKGYPAGTRVLAGEKGAKRVIEINGKQFLSDGYTVYERGR